ncbi:MAG: AAA family ATPase, partial [Betaproteobacteria bacterium]|nr:AAA family ATPase [Betaproteobacteria bacterium]
MSGLAANETRIEPGAINVRLGEGRTAEVLRNICFDICQQQNGNWDSLVEHIDELFGVRIEQPSHVAARGEIAMEYRQHDSKARFDLSASGRGLQQTLLILAFLYSRPAGSIVLLDEPDAHLEILRQRQIYNTIKNVADANKSQIVIASHSEVLLRESFEDTVIAFVGKPHRISLSRQSEVRKSLETIGFDQYYLAKQTGWVLYLEGPTDLAILQSFAKRLEKNDASAALARPFVKYVGNNLDEIRKHFFGLREALPGLRGVAVLDRIDPPAKQHENGLKFNFWKKREIENYLCSEKTLQRYVQETTDEEQLGALFYQGERAKR